MKIKITKTVDIKDLTQEDIKSLDLATLQKVVTELTSKPSKPLTDTNTHLKTTKTDTANPQVTVKASNPKPKARLSSFISKGHTASSTGHEIGTKSGKSSIYHYTYFHTATKSYRIVHGSKVSFKNEIEAALASDKYLDDKRNKAKPRNRDEFTEVMEAYEELHSAPAISDYMSENGIQ